MLPRWLRASRRRGRAEAAPRSGGSAPGRRPGPWAVRAPRPVASVVLEAFPGALDLLRGLGLLGLLDLPEDGREVGAQRVVVGQGDPEHDAVVVRVPVDDAERPLLAVVVQGHVDAHDVVAHADGGAQAGEAEVVRAGSPEPGLNAVLLERERAAHGAVLPLILDSR